ncbi:MAG TPA: LuxR C-terminal-related transcriptional regulator [Steroidobacteraceae bacterium]|nr:LuxR C-terminal-related transcriptional regulator [Steroidobacteraceae bacterium]
MTLEQNTSDNAELAIAHAFQSGNRADCVQLIGRCARTWLKAGEVGSVLRWTGRLSRTEILDNELITTSYIASMIFRRRFTEATAWLRDAEASLATDSTLARARLRTLRLMLAVLSENASDDALLEEVGEGPGDSYLSGALIALQAYALLRKNRFDAAKRRALRAKDLLSEHGDAYGASYADVLVLFAQRLSGDLAGSAHTCEQLYATVEHGSRNPAWVNAASAMAYLRYEQNRFPEARALCLEVLPLLPIASTPDNLASVYITLSRLESAAGNVHAAMRLLDYLPSAMEDGRHARLVALAVYERVRLALTMGDIEYAHRIANEASIDDLAHERAWIRPRTYEPGWERLGQAHALLLLQERKLDACRVVLQSLIKSASQAGCIVRSVSLEALLAHCEWLAGNRAQAFAAVDRALARTRVVGFTRSVFDEAPELAAIIRNAIAERKLLQPLPSGYVERWAAVLGSDDVCVRNANAPAEALTERERHVLTLVAAGMRNEEISDRLQIALSTTKWHLKNIFAKLGVACRTEALVRAKQLHLID